MGKGESVTIAGVNKGKKDTELEGINGMKFEEVLVPSGKTRSAGWTVSSAAVPNARPCWASNNHTRSPTETWPTPSPTASTIPAPSWPGVTSSQPLIMPARNFQSVGLTPALTSRTRTSPGPGSGTSRSTSRRTDDGPVSA